MNKIQKFELLLDNVISKIAKTKVSQVSGLGHCEPHHMIHRMNKLFRWDLKNIMFITRAEHFNIHSNGVDYCNYEQHLFVVENKNKGLREYLQNNNLTYIEFLENTYFTLTGKIKKVKDFTDDCIKTKHKKQLTSFEIQAREKAKEVRHNYYLHLKELKKTIKK